jgi:hypothetical protein
MGLYAGVDYNLTQSRLQHIYHGRATLCQSTLTLCQSRLYPPITDFGFSLSAQNAKRMEEKYTFCRTCFSRSKGWVVSVETPLDYIYDVHIVTMYPRCYP